MAGLGSWSDGRDMRQLSPVGLQVLQAIQLGPDGIVAGQVGIELSRMAWLGFDQEGSFGRTRAHRVGASPRRTEERRMKNEETEFTFLAPASPSLSSRGFPRQCEFIKVFICRRRVPQTRE